MKKLVLVFGILVLLVSCTQIRQIVAIKDLKIKFLNVNVKNITWKGVDLDLNFRARNPNQVNAVLAGFVVDIFANNVKVGKATLNKTLKVPASGTAIFTIPLHLDWDKLSQSLSSAMKRKSVLFKATGYAMIDTPVGKLKFKVADYTRNIK